MHEFRAGELVLIPCDIQRGAFPDEFLITLDSETGIISGFVRVDDVFDIKEETGYIKGMVREVTDTIITVWVRGSFFTTTGLADLSHEWAKSHLQRVA